MSMRLVFEHRTLLLEDAPEGVPHADWDNRVSEYRAHYPSGEHWWPPGHVLGWEHTFVRGDYGFLTTVADGDESHLNIADTAVVQRVLAATGASDTRGEGLTVT